MEDSSKLMSAPWRCERIEDASHWMMLDRPGQVNELLLDWVGELRCSDLPCGGI
jgi:pimeloyl-ACP methyl ester carboxylesterase